MIENRIDRHVGGRVRARRIELGISESAFAFELGCGLEDLKAYETGERRIGARLLAKITPLLRVTPHYFFAALYDGEPEET